MASAKTQQQSEQDKLAQEAREATDNGGHSQALPAGDRRVLMPQPSLYYMILPKEMKENSDEEAKGAVQECRRSGQNDHALPERNRRVCEPQEMHEPLNHLILQKNGGASSDWAKSKEKDAALTPYPCRRCDHALPEQGRRVHEPKEPSDSTTLRKYEEYKGGDAHLRLVGGGEKCRHPRGQTCEATLSEPLDGMPGHLGCAVGSESEMAVGTEGEYMKRRPGIEPNTDSVIPHRGRRVPEPMALVDYTTVPKPDKPSWSPTECRPPRGQAGETAPSEPTGRMPGQLGCAVGPESEIALVTGDEYMERRPGIEPNPDPVIPHRGRRVPEPMALVDYTTVPKPDKPSWSPTKGSRQNGGKVALRECKQALGRKPRLAEQEEEEAEGFSSLQLISTVIWMVGARMTSAFERPWPLGTEPVWWTNLLEEGFEMQRDGRCMWEIAQRLETAVASRDDDRYKEGVAIWLDGLKRRWDEENQAQLPPRGGPTSDEQCEEFVVSSEAIIRRKWLEALCPVACNNWSLERYFREFSMSSSPNGDHMRDEAELEEAQVSRLSRSRTPQRRWRDPARGPRPIDRRLLNRREGEGDNEELSLVVKKFLLKKKDSKHLRRLIDNPAAWRQGPGVTVTTSMRTLAPRTRPSWRRCETQGEAAGTRASGTSSAPWAAAASSGEVRHERAARPPSTATGSDCPAPREGTETEPEQEEMDELGASFL